MLGAQSRFAYTHFSKEKVAAIKSVPSRKKKELLFWGWLTFTAGFLEGNVEASEWLQRLLVKVRKWACTTELETANQNRKGLYRWEAVLVRYDLKGSLVLLCDASPVGIGASSFTQK